jgi:polyadenylate-binding protein
MDVFGALGPISSIRLLRDAVTRRSLRYAYVNFQHPSDAERALDTLNFSEIRGQSIRVMWLQRDPSVRKSGRGNIFIKNLPKDMDHKGLYDICSPFGNILSCKVATLPTGLSKGYGYVHYETQEAAELAIKNINGMNIDGSRVVVEPFVARKDRGATADVKYNNVYVKNVAETVTEEKLTDLFAPFGPVSSVHIKRDENGVSKGFGFVTFDDHDGAKNAVDAMNGKEIEGKVMYAGRAQKKAERQAELRRMFEQMKLERASKYQGVNLYVKNLDDVVDDDGLRKLFEEFGNITSAKVMRDDKGNSRGGHSCRDSAQRSDDRFQASLCGNCTEARVPPAAARRSVCCSAYCHAARWHDAHAHHGPDAEHATKHASWLWSHAHVERPHAHADGLYVRPSSCWSSRYVF